MPQGRLPRPKPEGVFHRVMVVLGRHEAQAGPLDDLAQGGMDVHPLPDRIGASIRRVHQIDDFLDQDRGFRSYDVRAKDRLVIDYDEVSEELGFEIDAYTIQHEMSTHYGRMVATDDALMLFSDPTEAMQYLMA